MKHRALFISTLIGLTIALNACQNLVDPPLADGTQAFQPPQVYARWWAMTEACSGLSGSLANVSWFAVPDAPTSYYSVAGNRIVLSAAAKLDGGHVRHEMLHALLGAGGHPRRYYLERCGGVVNCRETCIADSEPPPQADPNTPRVTGEELEVRIDVAPTSPTRDEDDGFFTVTVSARNPALHPVVVTLLQYPGFPARGFFLNIVGPMGGYGREEPVLDPAVSTFAAGETKRQVFDFAIRDTLGNGGLPPGTYRVAGMYGEHWVTYDGVVLR